MGVLNELLGAVSILFSSSPRELKERLIVSLFYLQIKLIKIFRWKDRWIGRVLDSRVFDLKWLIKGRLNSIMFVSVWTAAPILDSVTSFFTYVYIGGNELTVGNAFTAVTLFAMLRQPLNTLPTFIVSLLQVC